MKFHLPKGKPFLHCLSNLHDFLSTITLSATAINMFGQKHDLKEYLDNYRCVILKLLVQLQFLCCLRSIVGHRDHFVWHPSVCVFVR